MIPRLPKSLTELDRFLLWDTEFSAEGKASKVPYRIDGRRRASTTDTRDWSSFEEACQAWRNNPWFAGLGFVFHHADGLVGVDLDCCLDAGGIPKEWVRGILLRFSDTYCERSVSGFGLHVFCKAQLPKAIVAPVKDGQIEVYSTSRFFTISGNRWRDCPLEVEDHCKDIGDLVARLAPARNGKGAWPVNPAADGFLHPDNRHPFMMSLAGTLKNRGILPEIIEALLHMVNERMCDPPKPKPDVDDEIKNIVGYVWR